MTIYEIIGRVVILLVCVGVGVLNVIVDAILMPHVIPAHQFFCGFVIVRSFAVLMACMALGFWLIGDRTRQ